MNTKTHSDILSQLLALYVHTNRHSPSQAVLRKTWDECKRECRKWTIFSITIWLFSMIMAIILILAMTPHPQSIELLVRDLGITNPYAKAWVGSVPLILLLTFQITLTWNAVLKWTAPGNSVLRLVSHWKVVRRQAEKLGVVNLLCDWKEAGEPMLNQPMDTKPGEVLEQFTHALTWAAKVLVDADATDSSQRMAEGKKVTHNILAVSFEMGNLMMSLCRMRREQLALTEAEHHHLHPPETEPPDHILA